MKLSTRKFFKKAVEGWRKISTQKTEETKEAEKEITLPVKVSPVVSQTSIPIHVPVEVEVERKTEEKEREKIEIEGIAIPKQFKIIPSPPSLLQPEEFSLSYPLIPRNPKPEEKVFAFAKIYWDRRKQSYFYELVEPKLDERMKEIIKKIKELIEQRLDVDLSKVEFG
jgi:hypothetical protein